MLKTIFIDESQQRVLLFDSSETKIFWGKVQEYSEIVSDMLDVRFLQQIYDEHGKRLNIPVPSDIKISKYISNEKFSIKKIFNSKLSYLYKSAKQIGIILTSVSNKDIDFLNKNGGVVISTIVNNSENIIFIMPYLKTIAKNVRLESINKSIFHEQQVLFNDDEKGFKEFTRKQEEVQLEAIIKIPKELTAINKLDFQKLNESSQRTTYLLNEINNETKQRLNHITLQLNQLLDTDNNTRYLEDRIKNLEIELMKCHKTIDNLHNDKNILALENQKAEQIALNKLKSKFNLSKVAIQRQADLNNNSMQEEIIELITKSILKTHKGQDKIDTILKDEEIISGITALSDNFATKIQSLIDIKSNLEELEILEKRNDE